MYKSRPVILVMFMIVVVVLSGVVIAQDDMMEGKGGRLVVADANSNTSLDPFISSWHSWPHYAIYPTLFARAEDMSYVGFLADSWGVSEDSKALTINLIDNASFTDGTPIDAAAIKWNLDKYSNPETGASQGADLIGLLEAVEIVDDYSFTMHLSSPYAPLFFVLSGLEIVSPTAYEALGPDNFGTSPVGGGPFVLKELVTDNYVLFERNPDFNWAPEEIYDHPGPVFLDELQILFIGEEQTVLAALETGEVSLAGIPTQNLADAEANPDIDVHVAQLNQIRYVGFNTSKDPWTDPELRRAFAYATDRQEFVTLAWDDLAQPLYQPLPPTIWGHNPDLNDAAPSFDPDKAMEILDSLGYVDVDGDGLRESPDGSAWSVPLATASPDEWRRQAEVLEAQWRDVGIPLEILLLEFSALVDLTTTGTHDLFLLLYGYSDPSILTYFFDPGRKGGSNRAWFSTDELTALLNAADTQLDPDLRYEAVTAVSEYIIEASPWVYLAVPPALTGVRAELENWRMHPDLSFLYWNAYYETE